MDSKFSSFHVKLNQQQEIAVSKFFGYVLVLAGAGTGKTRVLTTKIIKILDQDLALPHQILAVTFTNKAANEMRSRVQNVVHSSPIWIGTFHSICLKILRAHAEKIGYSPGFLVVDQDDQERLLKRILKEHDYSEKDLPLRLVVFCINRWRDLALFPEQIIAKSNDERKILQVYDAYHKRLLDLNACDFSGFMLWCLYLFENFPEVVRMYQEQFLFILVDEYQDTNVSQHSWLSILSQRHKNLCCVGDDDQSIYGWRGAEIGNILRFSEDYEDVTTIRLEQNYRSDAHILKGACGLISHNRERLGKELWTELTLGNKIKVKGAGNSDEEAVFVSQKIEEFQRKYLFRDMAILVRAGFQTRAFEERLLLIGIPHQVIGGLRFYERTEIKDALAYVRFLVDENDSIAFERIINVPKRGIGKVTLKNIHVIARNLQIPLAKAAKSFCAENHKLAAFFGDFARWRALLEKVPHARVIEIVLKESGYLDMYKVDKNLEAQGRLENLSEFIKAVDDYPNFESLLEYVALATEKEHSNESVSIMTLHAAKGLEFSVVFLSGWEEGLFPHQKTMEEKGRLGLEEERRLAYVGISRAMSEVLITFALFRKQPGGGWQRSHPSRFIKEIPREHVEILAFGGTLSRPSRRLSHEKQQNRPQAVGPRALP